MSPLDFVLSQIDSGKAELDDYPPKGCNWHARSRKTAKLLIPWLVDNAIALRHYCQDVANSRLVVRELWDELKHEMAEELPDGFVKRMETQLKMEAIWTEKVSGTIMSRAVERFIIGNFPGGQIAANGHSDFPDLFLTSKDYSGLPAYKRGRGAVYGASLKGPELRPCKVPDGLEIKSCNDTNRVDCHDSHVGLHLALKFHEDHQDRRISVDDIQISFLRHENYRRSATNTATTTLKSSFKLGDAFISILHTKSKQQPSLSKKKR